MAEVNPEMLALARESRGMTQAALAKQLGFTQGKVSKWENSLLRPSGKELARIAAVLRYSADFFCQKERIAGLGGSFLFHRKRRRVSAAILKRIEAEANIRRIQVNRLLRSARIEATAQFQPFDIDEFDGDPERVADQVRSAWKLPLGPIRNLTETIESAGGIVVATDFGTTRIDAVHLWVPPSPPLFLVNCVMPGDRLRFTLAHEVGHAIMHAVPTPEIEDEANRFAAQLLMPAEEIQDHLHDMTIQRAASLKAHWRVAMQALIVRAYHLGCISKDRYRRLFTALSARGYRTREPIAIPPEEPTVLGQLMSVHREQLGYDAADLAQVMLTDDPRFYPTEHEPASVTVGEPCILTLRPTADRG